MITRRSTHRMFGLAISLTMLAVVALGGMGTAFADGVAPSTDVAGSGSVSGTPGTVTISHPTLSGSNQVIDLTIPIEVTDLTGSGAGWHVTITSTLFANGTHTLAAPLGTGVTSVVDGSGGGGTYTDPTLTNTLGVIPADTAAPVAQTLTSAAANSGMGKFMLTAAFTIALPSNAYSGTYSSVITLATIAGLL